MSDVSGLMGIAIAEASRPAELAGGSWLPTEVTAYECHVRR